MILTYTAKNLTQFTKRIKQIEDKWDDPKNDSEIGLWFRGCQKSQWGLVPKLYRFLDRKTNVHEEEDDIREDFIRKALILTEYKPENSWEWYFLMQHYGAPTRLLDWTENPFLGLYFAMRDNEGLQDAVLWIIDPWWLNEQVIGENEVLPPGTSGLTKADTRRYRPWLPDRFDTKHRLSRNRPVAVYPNYFDRRIAAQRSCFTIHGLNREGLEKMFRGSNDRIAKIIVPSYATEEIREELDSNSIDEVTAFPDLQGLGTASSKSFLYKNAPMPHSGVYTRLQPSDIDGVGVFAIRKITKGTRLFSEDSDEMMWVSVDELPKRKELRKFYEDFAVWKHGRCGCPKHFHRLTMAWYLNDPPKGEKPNVECYENYEFRALRDIAPGKELTVDSSTYSDHASTGTKKKKIHPKR